MPLVVLDPGHGAEDDRNFYGSGYEWDEGINNYLTCVLIKQHLIDNFDVTVKMTRNKVTDNPWPGRGRMYSNPDMFYSRHSNASGTGARGTEVYYQPGDSISGSFAATHSAKVAAFFGHNNRGAKAVSMIVCNEAKSAGAKIAVLVEAGFHDTQADATILVTKRPQLAVLEAEGIAQQLNLQPKTVFAAGSIGELPIGAKIKFGSHRITTKQPITWKVAANNHSGYPSDTVTLIANEIIDMRCMDGAEVNSAHAERKERGSNNWSTSNMRMWLNSEKTSWYTRLYNVDEPPRSDNTNHGTEYVDLPGFLTNFLPEEISNIVDTTLKTANPKYNGVGYTESTNKVFLASRAEVGLGSEGSITEGSQYALFASSSERICSLTHQAFSESSCTRKPSDAIVGHPWWLRSPSSDTDSNFRVSKEDGTSWSYYATTGRMGLRPVINVKADMRLTGTVDSSGAYIPVYNSAPTNITSISIPTTLSVNERVTISWGASTDADGDPVTYKLERVADGVKKLLYSGTSRSYVDTIPTGVGTIYYQVYSTDGQDDSVPRKSVTKTVIQNIPPTITASTTDFGTKTSTFGFNITIGDAEGGSLKVELRMDGKLFSSKTEPVGNLLVFIPEDIFAACSNGSHTVQVRVTDSDGGTVSKNFSFRKNVSVTSFQTPPFTATVMPTKIKLAVQGDRGEGVTWKIEACNNAFDNLPTWEDITSEVDNRLVHVFQNATKVHKDWAVAVKVSMTRTTPGLTAYCTSITGNYE